MSLSDQYKQDMKFPVVVGPREAPVISGAPVGRVPRKGAIAGSMGLHAGVLLALVLFALWGVIEETPVPPPVRVTLIREGPGAAGAAGGNEGGGGAAETSSAPSAASTAAATAAIQPASNAETPEQRTAAPEPAAATPEPPAAASEPPVTAAAEPSIAAPEPKVAAIEPSAAVPEPQMAAPAPSMAAMPKPVATPLPTPPRRKPARPHPAPAEAASPPMQASAPAPEELAAAVPAPQPGAPGTGSGPGGTRAVGTGAEGAGHGAIGDGPIEGPGDDYLDRLRRWLNKYKRYPDQAKKDKQQGHLIVSFTILRDGTVRNPQIEHSSGFPLLDEAALAMLREASPVPPLPPSYRPALVSVDLPVEFELGFFARNF